MVGFGKTTSDRQSEASALAKAGCQDTAVLGRRLRPAQLAILLLGLEKTASLYTAQGSGRELPAGAGSWSNTSSEPKLRCCQLGNPRIARELPPHDI